MNYALPPSNLIFGDYTISFKHFYWEIQKLPNEDHEFENKKTDIKKEAYLFFDNYKFWNELNICKEEHKALKNLCSNKNVAMQKADNGSSVILVNRANYVHRMKELLWDMSTKDISQ